MLTVSLQGIQARTIREAVLGADRETEGEREQGCQRSYLSWVRRLEKETVSITEKGLNGPCMIDNKNS